MRWAVRVAGYLNEPTPYILGRLGVERKTQVEDMWGNAPDETDS